MARGRLNRWNRRLGIWMARGTAPTPAELEASQAEAARRLEAEREAERRATERIAHPTVKPPNEKCYRVIRYVKRNGMLDFEDIGWSRRAGPALAIMLREIGRARILGPDGKVYSDNHNPIEDQA